jgi:putative metallohydrolase (TIGR04338 family)
MVWIRTDDSPAIMPWNLRYGNVEKFNPLQPRDDFGRWSDTGSGGGGIAGAPSDGSFAVGGNGLNIEEVVRLHKSSDPLQQLVYWAEDTLDAPAPDVPAPDAPKRDTFASSDEYSAAYKQYSRDWTAWAVDQRAQILTDKGKKFLDGKPAGVKKYVQDVIKQDWFVERFGDGSSLPPLEVKVSNTNAAGRHILEMTKRMSTGEVVSTRNEISLDRPYTKNESTILHEISHYATAISQTAPFHGHGVEFAKNHIFIVDKVVGSARAEALAAAYIEYGVDLGN